MKMSPTFILISLFFIPLFFFLGLENLEDPSLKKVNLNFRTHDTQKTRSSPTESSGNINKLPYVFVLPKPRRLVCLVVFYKLLVKPTDLIGGTNPLH